MANDLNFLFKTFKQNRFDPSKDSEETIPNQSGNYIICLKPNSKLPSVLIIPTLTSFNGLKVIYTGIASVSLRSRDYRQHFKGNNAGRSTFRKSLGVLFGYKLIARDKDPSNGKTKFGHTDEKKLSDWMSQNLLMFFLPTADFADIEIALIDHFNPPLNLKDNHNSINADFRKLLSNLRSGRINVKPQNTNTTTAKKIVKKNLTQTNTTHKKLDITNNSKINNPIGKVNEQGKGLIKKRNTKTKKKTQRIPIKRKEVEEMETNPMKILWYAIAAICLVVSYIKLSERQYDELFWCILIVGIIAFLIAKSIKPITKTISNLSSSFLEHNYENYNENTQNTDMPIIINKTTKTNQSNTNQRRQLNENEIYGLVNDVAGEGIEDEVRDYLELEREERNDRHNNDDHSEDKQENDEDKRDDW